MIFECDNCGTKFERNSGRTKVKFCSMKCSNKSWYKRNREKFLKYSRAYRKNNDYDRKRHQRVREEALKIVGRGAMECSKCGVNNPRILEINHTGGGGRKEINGHASSYYWFMSIIKGDRKTEDLNILCKVCNAADFVERKYGSKFEVRFLEGGNTKV